MRNILNIKSNGCTCMFIWLIVFSTIPACKHSIKEPTHNDKISESSKFGELNASAPQETIQLGQLIGEWNCISKDLVALNEDTSVWYTNKAKWKWEYILGGHALLNNWWQEDTSPNPITKEYFAAGIFIFNTETQLWEATIMNSRPHKISPKFQLKYQNERLEMSDGSGKWLVTFFDITKDSFEWKYEVLKESGDWKAISTISARRN